jgi:hypothetical protein
MSELDSESLALKREIEAAFADVRSPGDAEDDLCESLDGGTREEVLRLFGGKRWQDYKDEPLALLLPDPKLPNTVSSGALSPRAFRYFLPVFLLGSAFHRRQLDAIPEYLLHDFVDERMELLSGAQLKAVLSFLGYMKKRYEGFGGEKLGEAVASVKGLLDRAAARPQ